MTAAVIGLGGHLRAGKDEVAAHLQRTRGFVVLGMSDALHEAMLAIDPLIPINASASAFGVHGEFIRYSALTDQVGYVKAKENPEVRRLLQRLGTEVGRDMIGTNTWTDIMAAKINRFLMEDQPVAVTGIRFLNELVMIRQFAGRGVWVERPSLAKDAAAATHASENGVTGSMFDHIIVNDGTLEDLYRKVDEL